MWWAALAMAASDAAPSDHTVVYYNARMALREDRPLEATKLWFLRNAMEAETGRVSPHDADFHSVTWAALGDLGICQDGHPTDEDGVGLWPLALHNWVVRNRSRRGKRSRPTPFAGFEVGRQQRFISIGDVLGSEELRTVSLFRGGCARPRIAMVTAGLPITAKLSGRIVAADLMRWLLERSKDTLVAERVRGTSVIDARLFDVHLQLAELAEREARRKEREKARQGRDVGLSRESIDALREDAPRYTFDEDSEPARILRECPQWPASEWMALSPDRRLFLFDHARTYGADPEVMDALALEILDELVARGEGAEAMRWIAHRRDADPEAVWGDERGARLLTLDRESGFRERAVIALHRGVSQLETGDLQGALRSLAYALQHAPESEASDTVHSLALRWLSYVTSQFEITDSLLVTLQELVPQREYGVLLEDLMWSAAFRSDSSSFERGIRNQIGRGALERRLAMLVPLASGDVEGFAKGVDAGLERSPSETMRFLDRMVQRLELEDGDVRGSHLPTLARLSDAIEPLADPTERNTQSRRARSLLERMQSITEGLGGLGPNATDRQRARGLDPSGEVYAGSVRLAPSDPLPWPFEARDVPAPSVFTPIDLTPVEWREPDGDWVFGWSIGG